MAARRKCRPNGVTVEAVERRTLFAGIGIAGVVAAPTFSIAIATEGVRGAVTVQATTTVPKGLLPAQTYIQRGLFRDTRTQAAATAAAVHLSAKQAVSKVPADAMVLEATDALDRVKVTNTGEATSDGTVTITVYLTPDGTVAGGTAVASDAVTVTLGHGRSTVVPVPLGRFPGIAAGIYRLVATVEAPDGVVTSSAASGPITLNLPVDVPAAGAAPYEVFLPVIAPVAKVDRRTGEATLTSIRPTVALTDVGGATIRESVTLTYYVTPNWTFLASASEVITSDTLMVTIKPHGTRRVQFKLAADLDLGRVGTGLTDEPLYYAVVASDAAGHSVADSRHRPLNFHL